jgi:hypothetical protein
MEIREDLTVSQPKEAHNPKEIEDLENQEAGGHPPETAPPGSRVGQGESQEERSDLYAAAALADVHRKPAGVDDSSRRDGGFPGDSQCSGGQSSKKRGPWLQNP